ncbi:MAG: alpha/beta hydrolase [Bacteroidetes bacterium HGW-Bacteroidetes-3]|jgi:pimeloyl-ACP methyl ester carboxylesterase|nr:MAG: alpha/beta hydrolase [Bacteroidetes bacterium HGW-Bacteroidetes-3]
MKKKYFKISALILFLIVLVLYFIPASKSDFFKLYVNNDKPAQNLKEFKSRATKEIVVDGVSWNYYAGGNGNKTIFFIHGMGGSYDLWWQQIIAFEKDYKVISYTLPASINSLEKASEGIFKILEAEKVDKFYAVGTSMGGYIAQYLVNTIPSRIEKAVFGNTFPPNNLIAKENETKGKVIPYLPEIIISKLGEKKLNEEIVPAAKNSPLLKAFLVSLPFSKEQFINRYYIVIDKFTAFSDSYNTKRIPKLIIESDNDPLIQPKLQKEIKELYANAEVFTFHNEGHFPYINASETYNKVLRDFLTKENDYEIAEKTIVNYFEGRRNAELQKLQSAFSENAILQTISNDEIVTISLENYLNAVKTDGSQEVETKILEGDITNNIAVFKTEFKYKDKSYIDYLTALKSKDGWKIVSKTFTKTN